MADLEVHCIEERFRSSRFRCSVDSVESIGKGRFSDVYAVTLSRGSQVAVKLINTTTVTSQYRTTILAKEIECGKKLRHPHIIKFKKNDEFDSRIFLIMEYGSGGDMLAHIQKNGPVDEMTASLWMNQIISAVTYMHKLGLVHRNLKLENIIFTSPTTVKISGFGFVCRADCNISITNRGAKSYCAPEILTGQATNLYKADVWMIGIITYFITHGRLPFADYLDTDERLLHAELHFYALHQNLSSSCKIAIKHLLHYDPERRPYIHEVARMPFFAVFNESSGDRKKYSREKKISTVSMARKIEKRRLVRKNSKLDQIVYRLQIIETPGLNIDRKKVVCNITKLIANFGPRKYKALHWVIEKLYELIPMERNPAVRFSLIYLLEEFLGSGVTWNFESAIDESQFEMAVSVLKQQTTIHERLATLRMLLSRLYEIGTAFETSDDLARLCLKLVTDCARRNKNLSFESELSGYRALHDRKWDEAEALFSLNVLHEIVDDVERDVVREIYRDELVMRVVFDTVECEDGSIFSSLFRATRKRDRIHLLNLYEHEMKRTFMVAPFWSIERCLSHDEFASFFVSDADLMNRLWEKTREARYKRNAADDTFRIIVDLFQHGLNVGGGVLEKVLGMGFLSAATSYFASINHPRDHREAAVFQSVLSRFPQFEQQFKAAAMVGDISHTAQLGKTIPEKVRKPTEYTLEDYKDDL